MGSEGKHKGKHLDCCSQDSCMRYILPHIMIFLYDFVLLRIVRKMIELTPPVAIATTRIDDANLDGSSYWNGRMRYYMIVVKQLKHP